MDKFEEFTKFAEFPQFEEFPQLEEFPIITRVKPAPVTVIAYPPPTGMEEPEALQ